MPSAVDAGSALHEPRPHRLIHDLGAVFLAAVFCSLMLAVVLMVAVALVVGC